MLWLLEFTREGHRYRAELRSQGGSSRDPAGGMAIGFWFVSMDGNPPMLAFEADVHDEDTEEFRGRVVSAAHAHEGEPNREETEARLAEPPPDAPDDETEDWPRHPH